MDVALGACFSSPVIFVINDAAAAYRGVIPDDRWHEPYLSEPALESEIAAGVRFLGWYSSFGVLFGVMGTQDVRDVTLIHHAYVLTARRRRGIGSALITALMGSASRHAKHAVAPSARMAWRTFGCNICRCS